VRDICASIKGQPLFSQTRRVDLPSIVEYKRLIVDGAVFVEQFLGKLSTLVSGGSSDDQTSAYKWEGLG
jgi:hypothetical protein